MEKLKLLTWSIGFEVPFFKESDQESVETLASKLTASYKNWAEVLSSDIKFFKRSTGNMLLVFSIVILVNNDLVELDTFKDEWKSIQGSVRNALLEFISTNYKDYKDIKEVGYEH